MKRILALIIVATLGYFGYQYYQRAQLSHLSSLTTPTSSTLVINQANDKLSGLSSVLGASIVGLYDDGKDFLSEITAGKSDPIINRALKNIQDEVKDLPKETVDKVKYEFCKDVVIEYENKSSQ